MTSTEFTIGLDGSRNSSKVLKPPGGGSSDIFGTGATFASNECQRNKEAASNNTQNRLFGGTTENDAPTPSKRQNSSNIFGREPLQSARSQKKSYVRRNPITGEEYEMYPENEKKENGDKETNGHDEQENNIEQNGGETSQEKKSVIPPVGDSAQEKSVIPPIKTVTTSIRVRNPPGGKSSGIF